MKRNLTVEVTEAPVQFTGDGAAQRYNAACKALRCQGYIRFQHESDMSGCTSVWCNPDGQAVALVCKVEQRPLVTGFARMD